MMRARTRRRGAAMVEGVIVAPVLVLLLFGAIYERRLYVARAQARLQARQCAWEHASAGCKDEPASCSDAQPEAEPPDHAPDIAAIVRRDTDTGGLDPFSDIPLLGTAFRGVFGTTTRSSLAIEVPFPLDPSRVGTARGDMLLVCNSRHETVLDIGKDFMCTALSEFKLCEPSS